jgi:hypothetical protein
VIELRPAPGQTGSISINYADVVVQTLMSKQVTGALKVLVAGGVPLEYRPKRTRDRRVVVPDGPRRRCELAIEAIADLVSIAERCSRSIASPFPWVAFEPTSDAARAWLSEAVGIHELDRVVDISSASATVELSPEIIDGLSDRSGGVVLLAEAQLSLPGADVGVPCLRDRSCLLLILCRAVRGRFVRRSAAAAEDQS